MLYFSNFWRNKIVLFHANSLDGGAISQITNADESNTKTSVDLQFCFTE